MNPHPHRCITVIADSNKYTKYTLYSNLLMKFQTFILMIELIVILVPYNKVIPKNSVAMFIWLPKDLLQCCRRWDETL